KDPITGKDFKLLTINPDGSVNGSKVFSRNMNGQPLFGNAPIFGQQQQNTPQQGQQTPQQGFQGQVQQPGFQQPGFQQRGFQQQPGFQVQPQQQFTARGGNFGGQQSQPNPQSQQRGQQPAGAVGPGNIPGAIQVGNGGIVGVASESDKESIKVYNKRTKYDEWEFLALPNQQLQPGQNAPQQNPNAPQNVQQPGLPQGGTQTPFGGV